MPVRLRWSYQKPPVVAPPALALVAGPALLLVLGAVAAAPPDNEPSPADKRAPVVIKRRHSLTEEDLRKQLLKVPEVELDRDRERSTSAWLVKLAAKPDPEHERGRSRTLLNLRPDLAQLPVRMGAECRLDGNEAQVLQTLSRLLRREMGEAGSGHDFDSLRRRFLEDDDGKQVWLAPEAVPALVQLLQAEEEPARLLLVEVLSRIPGGGASAALGRRALFDLSAEVRAAAVRALAGRPRPEYRTLLVDGFRYPWAPVADHAAEALVALGDREAVPLLAGLRGEANPTLRPSRSRDYRIAGRDLVRVNHLRNCLLCHAASRHRADLVRGLIPEPDQPLPPATTTEYYEASQGLFVRADVTYLRQDFSVPQPVQSSGKWPGTQRYDYLVRTRPAGRDDFDPGRSSRHLDAILFVLKELDPGRAGW